jgi:hypothetical protein
MSPLLQLKTILLDGTTDQGVVLETAAGTALVAMARGTQRVAADVQVAKDDLVTVRAGRIISKRTGGDGGAVRVYHV